MPVPPKIAIFFIFSRVKHEGPTKHRRSTTNARRAMRAARTPDKFRPIDTIVQGPNVISGRSTLFVNLIIRRYVITCNRRTQGRSRIDRRVRRRILGTLADPTNPMASLRSNPSPLFLSNAYLIIFDSAWKQKFRSNVRLTHGENYKMVSIFVSRLPRKI